MPAAVIGTAQFGTAQFGIACNVKEAVAKDAQLVDRKGNSSAMTEKPAILSR